MRRQFLGKFARWLDHFRLAFHRPPCRRIRRKQRCFRPGFEFLEDRTVPAALLTTNLPDYAPGSTATLYGDGFQIGETVQLSVVHLDSIYSNQYPTWKVTDGDCTAAYADAEGVLHLPDLDGKADGHFQTTWDVGHIPGSTLQATATGLTSGEVATATFTDSPRLLLVVVGPQLPVPVIAGTSTSYLVTVTPALLGAFSADLSITANNLPAGVTASFSPDPVNFGFVSLPQIATLTLTTTTATPAGTYFFNVRATSTSNPSDWAEGLGALVVLPFPGYTVTPTSGLVTTENGGSATFDVVLTGDPGLVGNVVFNITTSNPAEGTVSHTQLTFNHSNWNVAQTVTVTGVNDIVPTADGDQPYFVTIALDPLQTTSLNYALIALLVDSEQTVDLTNLDNDMAVAVAVSPASVAENSGTGMVFTFTRGVVARGDMTVKFTLGGTADATDYTVSGATFNGGTGTWSVVIPDGAATATVTVTPVGDATLEPDETVRVDIVADPAYLLGSPTFAQATILNDDLKPTFTITSQTVTEGDAGTRTLTFTVNLSNPSYQPIEINYATSNGSATAGSDYVSTSGKLTFAAGQTGPQQITVTINGDRIDEADETFTVNLTSVDPARTANATASATGNTLDDDTSGVTISPVSGNTTEAGGSATFTVVLNSQPAGIVTVTITSDDPSEGTVQVPTTLTFDSTNWNLPKTVTIKGVNDFVDDGDVAYSVTVDTSTSADPLYAAFASQQVTLTNTDDDTAGLIVTPSSGLVTTEGGSAATFTVRLASQPTGLVTVNVTSSNPQEGTTSVTSLTFDGSDWNTAKTVTITGVNDDFDDGDQAYTITVSVDDANTADAVYHGVADATVSVTNQDNDTVGVTITPTSGLVTTEAGGTATFSVVLNTRPTGVVKITLVSSNPAEGQVEGSLLPTTLTFDASNWNVPQLVTVHGVDDPLTDGNVLYTVLTAIDPVTTDLQYLLVNVPDVTLTNADNDQPGITVTPTAGLVTTEAGGTATFNVVLNSLPVGIVTLTVTTSNAAEGTVSVTTLVFDSLNWATPQQVTVTGVNDAVDDGDQGYTITVAVVASLPETTDLLYWAVGPQTVAVTNLDDDTAGISVTPISGDTTEAGGTATFAVALTSKPTGQVKLLVSSSNPAEGTANPTTLIFDASNWNVAQTVTVTGVDDAIDDGDQTYSIVVAVDTDPLATVDAVYRGVSGKSVVVRNIDDDTPGITVNVLDSTTGEDGSQATVSIVLNTQPTAPVTITVGSSDDTEGTAAPVTLVFDGSNWNVAQTVTITGVDDNVVDGDVPYTLFIAPAASDDLAYAGLDPADVSLTNVDNDTAVSVAVAPVSVTENGGTGLVYTFTRTGVTNGAVTVHFTVSGTAGLTGDYTVSGSASFDSTTGTGTVIIADGATTASVTITPTNDATVELDETVAVTVSADPSYLLGSAPVAEGTIVNDDSATFTINDVTLVEGDSGTTAFTFTVMLSAAVDADVSVDFATVAGTAADGQDYTGIAGTLTFTAGGPLTQTITVQVKGDLTVELTEAFQVQLGNVQANGRSVSIADGTGQGTITNDDSATLSIDDVTRREGDAGTKSFTFTVTLSRPVDTTITVDYATQDGTATAGQDYVGQSNTLTFGPSVVKQTITVQVNGDTDVEADEAFEILLKNLSAGLRDVTLADNIGQGTITNDDTAVSVTVSPAATGEDAGTALVFTFTRVGVTTGDLTVSFKADGTASFGTSGADYTVGGAGVSFDAATGTGTLVIAAGQTTATVLVNAIGDAFVEADETATLTVKDGVGYHSGGAATATATILNDDVAGILVSPTTQLTIDNSSETATFTVVLTSRPTNDVVITVASSDPTKGTPDVDALTFTPDDWNVAQVVTVHRGTAAVSGDTYLIVTAAAVSADPVYNGMNAADVSVVDARGADANVISVLEPPPTSGSENGGPTTSGPTQTTQPAEVVKQVKSPADVGTVLGAGAEEQPLVAEQPEPPAPPAAPAQPPAAAQPPRVAVVAPAAAGPAPAAPEQPAPPLAVPPAAILQNQVLWDALDKFKEQVEFRPVTPAQIVGTVTVGGLAVSVGYVLLSGRAALWLLLALTAKPVWKQFDPLDVLFAWEKEKERRRAKGGNADDDESLHTILDRK